MAKALLIYNIGQRDIQIYQPDRSAEGEYVNTSPLDDVRKSFDVIKEVFENEESSKRLRMMKVDAGKKRIEIQSNRDMTKAFIDKCNANEVTHLELCCPMFESVIEYFFGHTEKYLPGCERDIILVNTDRPNIEKSKEVPGDSRWRDSEPYFAHPLLMKFVEDNYNVPISLDAKVLDETVLGDDPNIDDKKAFRWADQWLYNLSSLEDIESYRYVAVCATTGMPQVSRALLDLSELHFEHSVETFEVYDVNNPVHEKIKTKDKPFGDNSGEVPSVSDSKALSGAREPSSLYISNVADLSTAFECQRFYRHREALLALLAREDFAGAQNNLKKYDHFKKQLESHPSGKGKLFISRLAFAAAAIEKDGKSIRDAYCKLDASEEDKPIWLNKDFANESERELLERMLIRIVNAMRRGLWDVAASLLNTAVEVAAKDVIAEGFPEALGRDSEDNSGSRHSQKLDFNALNEYGEEAQKSVTRIPFERRIEMAGLHNCLGFLNRVEKYVVPTGELGPELVERTRAMIQIMKNVMSLRKLRNRLQHEGVSVTPENVCEALKLNFQKDWSDSIPAQDILKESSSSETRDGHSKNANPWSKFSTYALFAYVLNKNLDEQWYWPIVAAQDLSQTVRAIRHE